MKRILVVILVLNFATLSAQQLTKQQEVDAVTYRQWQQKDWQNLIKTGKKTQAKGIDFLLLDYRMGIAYYHLKKYLKAIPYFEKVYDEQPQDTVLQEYIYYAYLFSDRVHDAKILSKNMPPELLKKLQLKAKNPVVDAISVNTKYDFTLDNVYQPKSGEYVDQTSAGRQSWQSIGLQHLIGKRWTFNHSFSYLTTRNRVQTVTYPLPDHYEEDIRQFEYYAIVNYHSKKTWDLMLGGHLIALNLKAPNPDYNSSDPQSSVLLYDLQRQSFLAIAGVSKAWDIYRFFLSYSISNIGGEQQMQAETGAGIYPFANNRLYLETKLTGLLDNVSNKLAWAVTESVSWRPTSKIFVNAFGSFGSLRHYHDYNGLIVYNDNDQSLWRTGINLSYAITGKLWLSVLYKQNMKVNTFWVNYNENELKYMKKLINLGVLFQL